MFDFFDTVIKFFEMIGDFISFIVSGAATILGLLISSFGALSFISSYLVPSFLSISVSAVFAIAVVKLIFGR